MRDHVFELRKKGFGRLFLLQVQQNHAIERVGRIRVANESLLIQLFRYCGAFLLAPLEDTSDELFREQLAINLEAPLAVARHFLPAMKGRKSGSHILIGSVADWHAFPGNAAYAASKFGARGLHEVLLEECRGSGVRCTLISPGATDTAVWDRLDPDARADLPNRSEMLSPDDVAAAIQFAASQPPHVQIEVIRMGATP